MMPIVEQESVSVPYRPPFCWQGSLSFYPHPASSRQHALKHLTSLIAMQAEVVAAENAIRVLQGGPPSITPVNAFGSSGQHMAVVVEKLAATPPQYPRHPGKPSKRPLWCFKHQVVIPAKKQCHVCPGQHRVPINYTMIITLEYFHGFLEQQYILLIVPLPAQMCALQQVPVLKYETYSKV